MCSCDKNKDIDWKAVAEYLADKLDMNDCYCGYCTQWLPCFDDPEECRLTPDTCGHGYLQEALQKTQNK